MKAVHTVSDMHDRARKVLPPILFDFIEGGAGLEATIAANEYAFRRIGFRPRMGEIVSEPALDATILGAKYSMPVLLAPCGGLSMVHPAGQIGVVAAAARLGTAAVVGALSGESLERAAEPRVSVPRWFQHYPIGGRKGGKVLIRRAREAGYAVLVVTMDTPVGGHRLRDIRNGAIQASGLPISRVTPSSLVRLAPKVIGHPRWAYRFARSGFPLGQPNFEHLSSGGEAVTPSEATARMVSEPTGWKDVEEIRRDWSGSLVVKGLLSGADARRAVDAGADGIVVSNHGGRQFDATPASIDALPEVVTEVGDCVDVLLDSGVRTGADVVRALALGARAVLVGRPYIYGLAVSGQRGVECVLEMLRSETVRTLRLLGCPSVSRLDASWLDARFTAVD